MKKLSLLLILALIPACDWLVAEQLYIRGYGAYYTNPKEKDNESKKFDGVVDGAVSDGHGGVQYNQSSDPR